MSEVPMYLKHDPEADAAYLYLRPRDQDMRSSMTVPVDTTDTGRMINLDFDDAYRLVGIEIMDASATLAGSGLVTRASANPGLGTTAGGTEEPAARQPPESDKREARAGHDPGWANAFRTRCDPVMTTDLRRQGALLALLASLAAAYVTYVTWLVFGLARAEDPSGKVGPLDGWGLVSVGAAVAVGFFCLGLKLAWRPRRSG